MITIQNIRDNSPGPRLDMETSLCMDNAGKFCTEKQPRPMILQDDQKEYSFENGYLLIDGHPA